MKRYLENEGLTLQVLIDADRSVTRAYGAWHRIGIDAWNISRPALFVIDRGGIVRDVWVAERQDEFPSGEEIERAIVRVERG